jgi:hypothetical protein
MEPDDYAKPGAEMAQWSGRGEGPDRIAHSVEGDMAIYTGSTSGIPVNVLASFEAPTSGDSEAIADRVQTTASSLGLLKLNADPVKAVNTFCFRRSWLTVAELLRSGFADSSSASRIRRFKKSAC